MRSLPSAGSEKVVFRFWSVYSMIIPVLVLAMIIIFDNNLIIIMIIIKIIAYSYN